jgi:hypothetical protein
MVNFPYLWGPQFGLDSWARALFGHMFYSVDLSVLGCVRPLHKKDLFDTIVHLSLQAHYLRLQLHLPSFQLIPVVYQPTMLMH